MDSRYLTISDENSNILDNNSYCPLAILPLNLVQQLLNALFTSSCPLKGRRNTKADDQYNTDQFFYKITLISYYPIHQKNENKTI